MDGDEGNDLASEEEDQDEDEREEMEDHRIHEELSRGKLKKGGGEQKKKKKKAKQQRSEVRDDAAEESDEGEDEAEVDHAHIRRQEQLALSLLGKRGR